MAGTGRGPRDLMVDRDLVASKLGELAEHVARVRTRRRGGPPRICAVTAMRSALVRAVGLRNVIAHGYAGVRPEMVHAAATTGLADLETFAREVATWARGHL